MRRNPKYAALFNRASQIALDRYYANLDRVTAIMDEKSIVAKPLDDWADTSQATSDYDQLITAQMAEGSPWYARHEEFAKLAYLHSGGHVRDLTEPRNLDVLTDNAALQIAQALTA